MAKDTFISPSVILILSFVTKISSIPAQASLTEYLLASLGQQRTPVSVQPNLSRPPISYQSPGYGPGYQTYQTPPAYPNLPKPSPTLSGSIPSPLTAVANLAAAIPVPDSKPSKLPSVPKASDIRSSTFDSNVLNNLAIALQLLIVSNILNTPPVENPPQTKFDLTKFDAIPKFDTVPIAPITLSYPSKLPQMPLQSLPYIESPVRSQQIYSLESLLPSSKFLGSSGVVAPSMLGSSLTSITPRTNPRSSMTLMSPYEALGPHSPYSDPVLSSAFGNNYSKRDFQSPYASILAADKDLFSVSDLF